MPYHRFKPLKWETKSFWYDEKYLSNKWLWIFFYSFIIYLLCKGTLSEAWKAAMASYDGDHLTLILLKFLFYFEILQLNHLPSWCFSYLMPHTPLR